MTNQDTKSDSSLVGLEDILKENEESWSLFQCCHPKSNINCWSAFTRNWQLHHPTSDTRTALFQSMNETLGKTTEGSTADTCKLPKLSQPCPSLTEQGQERLRHVLDCVLDKAAKEKNNTLDQKAGNSILLQLATAAVKLAQDAQATALLDEPASKFDFDLNNDDTDNVLQRLLQDAKQNEAIKIAQLEHLERAQLLFNNYSILLQPLEVYVKTAMSSNSPVATMTLLLGRCEPSETLKCLWDWDAMAMAMDMDMVGGENKIYRLIKTCFHLAVALAFLVCGDDDTQMGLKLLASFSDDQNEAAIQAVCRSFVEFVDKKTPGNNLVGSREHFMEWHNRHMPGLLSALPLLMQTLLFPSVGEDEKTYCSLPALDNDKGSANILFSSSAPSSSWLFVLASTMPVVYDRKKVGSVVCHRGIRPSMLEMCVCYLLPPFSSFCFSFTVAPSVLHSLGRVQPDHLGTQSSGISWPHFATCTSLRQRNQSQPNLWSICVAAMGQAKRSSVLR
jgi:hypothetical protein